MRRKGFLPLAAAVLLFAVPAPSSAEQHTLRPGEYKLETEVKVEGVDRAVPSTATHCYSESDVKDGRKMAEAGQGRNHDCETTDMKTTASGSSWAMSCKSGSKATAEMTYRADGYEMTLNMETPGGPHGTMKMKIHTTARRTGDCAR